MKILNTKPEDIDALFEIYDAATLYQREVGKRNWNGFERPMVAKEISEGRQWKIVEDDQIACVFVLTYNDPLIWKEADADPAVYIHRIATRPEFRGRSYVKHIVGWVRTHALENNLKFIRMDTANGNDRINNYYFSCGFTDKGDTEIAWTPDLPEHYKHGTFRLFEIKLDEPADQH